MITLLLVGLLVAFALMGLVWLFSLIVSDVSIVDPAWGFGFVVVAVAYAVSEGDLTARDWLLLAIVGVWGLRLGGYLLWRKWGESEDYRYAAMREKRPASFPYRSLVTVFWLQAVLLWIVAWPIAAAIGTEDPGGIGPIEIIAAIISVTGLLFESIGDFQLARFKANPANQGKVLDSGLWRFTRHPNYFGDAMVWWGIGLIGVSTPGGWWSLVGPIVITILLARVSGVTLLEKRLASTKPGYAGYAARTNAFFPWVPRNPA
jgi:steroid 5-alpha reductase family enzyme